MYFGLNGIKHLQLILKVALNIIITLSASLAQQAQFPNQKRVGGIMLHRKCWILPGRAIIIVQSIPETTFNGNLMLL